MADNLTVDISGGSTAVIASDDISSVHYARSKTVWGADGAANDASMASPLPVQPGSGVTFVVSASSLPLPTGASTLAEQQTQSTALSAIQTSAQLIDDGIATAGSAITTKAMTACGTDGTNARILKTDASGELQVDVLSVAGNVAITAAALPLPTGASTLAEQQTQTTALGAVQTSVQLLDDSVATVASAITTKGLAAIGTDGTNARIIKTDSNGELQVDVLSVGGIVTTSATCVGDVAHDGADSGNPIKIGAKAVSSEPSAVANNDRANLYTDLTGKLIVRPHAIPEASVNGVASSTGTGDTSVIAAQGAGVKIYLTEFTIANSSSTNAIVEIKDGTTVKWRLPAPANSGAIQKFDPPIPLTANTALNAASLTGVTTMYFSANGYKGA